jgi:hypothetical protein
VVYRRPLLVAAGDRPKTAISGFKLGIGTGTVRRIKREMAAVAA